MNYRTNQNELLDDICYRVYGNTNSVEQVLDANPHLAQYGLQLPAGVVITLPEQKIAQKEQVRLWD